jgi:hypothetical protein
VAHLGVGQAATITLPDQNNKQYTGRVSEVSRVGALSGTLVGFSTLITFDQAPSDPLYGQPANVVATTRSASNVLCVPSTAVTAVQGSTGTLTARSNGKDTARTVQVNWAGISTQRSRPLSPGARRSSRATENHRSRW